MKKDLNAHDLYLKKLKNHKTKVLSSQVGLLIGFLIMWELLARLNIIDSFLFSCPSRMLATVKLLIDNNSLWLHVGTTLYECILGFLIATVLGTLIAIALWWNENLRQVLEPYMVILNALPKIALGPIIIIWVGAGTQAIVVMALLISIIITIISMLNAFLSVSEGKILLLRSMGATKLQILWKLILPASIPNLISVLKINVGLSWVGTIMGEYLVSKAGLGYLIVYGGTVFDLDLVMTSTVILCMLAGIMYFLVALLEKYVIKSRS